MQNSYNRSTTTTKMIKNSYRCQHIKELFDHKFVKMNTLHRIQYYHIPCQNNSLNLTCFYDNERICFCYEFMLQHLSNCFDFNHTMKMVVNVFQAIQIVLKNQYVFVSHVIMEQNVNLVLVDLLYHWILSWIIKFNQILI